MNEKSEIVLTLEISDLDIKCISYYIARCSLQSPITLRFHSSCRKDTSKKLHTRACLVLPKAIHQSVSSYTHLFQRHT